MTVSLVELKTGQSGVVTEIQGGWNFRKKINNLGILKGKKVTKVSSHFWRGPQTISIGKSRFSLGYGMASRVIVEVEK